MTALSIGNVYPIINGDGAVYARIEGFAKAKPDSKTASRVNYVTRSSTRGPFRKMVLECSKKKFLKMAEEASRPVF